MDCPECNLEIPDDSKFCKECGRALADAISTNKAHPPLVGERKHVTILFSDLSGYTAMTERLDPEEVKGIMSLIFGKITEITHSYEGFIERFIGDAVMAIFGIPNAHEDDPVRAIRAAMEIHAAVEGLSPRFEARVGRSLTMHSGINTGLVVTGAVDVEKGNNGLTGDAINLASRLEGLANAGEIVVGPETYKQAVNHFDFEAMKPTQVKGKSEPISIYQVLAVKDIPDKLHRTQGVRAELIGRQHEIDILLEAVQLLREGQGSLVAIVGEAGSGKSRLVREFKARLELKEIRWHESRAYSYTQNTPYYPLMNLLTRAFRIQEGDTPDQIRNKIENSLEVLLGSDNAAVPYIGGLFSLDYPQATDVSPEHWKTRLVASVHEILGALVQSGPTVLYFEDLHWADQSSIELLHSLIDAFTTSALFLCVYRPTSGLMIDQRQTESGLTPQTIQLHDLPGEDAQAMLRSLLQTDNVPVEMIEFVRQKAEGNPFYLEEVVNTLIGSEILVRDGTSWKIARPISEVDIPPSIHGVLASRIDRLDKQAKRVLQEASVIGRAFLYEILRRITDLEVPIDQYLSGLERLDLIRTLTKDPDLEYIFKHALTQDVVYNGLLKKERQEIHERIALAIEHIFQDRLPEYYENLAFHFINGKSQFKAVHYLSKSGEKCIQRYAVDEAHNYYEQALGILYSMPGDTADRNEILIEQLNKWALVYYYRGDFLGLCRLLSPSLEIAEMISNKEASGMYYAWLGWGIGQSQYIPETVWNEKNYSIDIAEEYLNKALAIGEETGNNRVICYACTWLSWLLTDRGNFTQGIENGKRAYKIESASLSDHYLHFKSLGGIAWNYMEIGHASECIGLGKKLIEYGLSHSHPRCLAMGYWTEGIGYYLAGDIPKAIPLLNKSVEVSIDPLYKFQARLYAIYVHIEKQDMVAAERLVNEAFEQLSSVTHKGMIDGVDFLHGIILVRNGQMTSGMKKMQRALNYAYKEKREGVVLPLEYGMAKFYFEVVKGDQPIKPLIIIKNIGFIIKHVPQAFKKAETGFQKVIQLAEEKGAIGFQGLGHFYLGMLYKMKRRYQQACYHLEKANESFVEAGAYEHIKQTEEALVSLNQRK